MTTKTKTETRKPSKAKAKAKALKASAKRSNGKAVRAKAKARKANGKARKASKANGKANGRAGGGKALSDFGNDSKLRLLKPKEIPARNACFKTGQTVSANLAAQKAKGYKGRRKFIRAQIAQGRVSVN